MDLRGIEPRYRECHSRALPLSYRPAEGAQEISLTPFEIRIEERSRTGWSIASSPCSGKQIPCTLPRDKREEGGRCWVALCIGMPLTAMLVLLHRDCRYGIWLGRSLGRPRRPFVESRLERRDHFHHTIFRGMGIEQSNRATTSKTPLKYGFSGMDWKIIHSRSFLTRKKAPREAGCLTGLPKGVSAIFTCRYFSAEGRS